MGCKFPANYPKENKCFDLTTVFSGTSLSNLSFDVLYSRYSGHGIG